MGQIEIEGMVPSKVPSLSGLVTLVDGKIVSEPYIDGLIPVVKKLFLVVYTIA